MHDYEHTLAIAAPVEDVYAALSTIEGLRGWWTPLVSGDPLIGGDLEFRFREVDEQIVMRVETLDASRAVTWTCLENSGHPEWRGTSLRFRLEPRDRETLLHFRHEGLNPTLECYDVCESGWNHFLASIASFAETGHGEPFS